jgi:hypothetical protein
MAESTFDVENVLNGIHDFNKSWREQKVIIHANWKQLAL